MNNVEFLSLSSITDDSCHTVLCKNNMCISDCIERHVHVSGKVTKAVAVAFALLHITRIPLSFTPCRCISDVLKVGSATWSTIYAPQLAKLITLQPLHQTLVDRGDAPGNRPATTSAAHSATLSLRSSLGVALNCIVSLPIQRITHRPAVMCRLTSDPRPTFALPLHLQLQKLNIAALLDSVDTNGGPILATPTQLTTAAPSHHTSMRAAAVLLPPC